MNCKPGDLAWIVRCPEAPENVWRLVLVVSPHPFFLNSWTCEALQPLTGFLGNVRVPVVAGLSVAIDDAWLKPLPPDENVEESIKEVETT